MTPPLEMAASCTPRPPVEERALLSREEAGRLEAMFKTLANGSRLRILHALARAPGLCVSELGAAVGMKPQAVSNQLQRLVDRGILQPDRRGNQVHYRIVDPCVVALLDRGLCLAEDAAAANPGAAPGLRAMADEGKEQ